MKVVLCYSGGLDSTVLLSRLLKDGDEVRCLSVDYGQRHKRELTSAKDICLHYGVEHKIADLRGVRELLGGSSQTSDIPVPEGHYAEESMKITVVPNRNMILLSLATAWAISTKSQAVAFAAHAGDHAIYPDCRPEFAEALGRAVNLCDWAAPALIRPFLYPKLMDKTDIVRLGDAVGAPMAASWSCYKGGEHHCGKCGTCTERKEAFKLAGVKDPTKYLS